VTATWDKENLQGNDGFFGGVIPYLRTHDDKGTVLNHVMTDC